MEVVFGRMLSGCQTIRAVETFSEIYGERVPDTTLHDVLKEVDGEPLREVLVREVKDALRAHELPKEAYPVRITAINGKSVSVSRQKVGVWSDAIGGDGEGSYRPKPRKSVRSSSTDQVWALAVVMLETGRVSFSDRLSIPITIGFLGTQIILFALVLFIAWFSDSNIARHRRV